MVTSFEYQLHPVKDITAGIFFFPIDKGARGAAVLPRPRATAPGGWGWFPPRSRLPRRCRLRPRTTARRSSRSSRAGPDRWTSSRGDGEDPRRGAGRRGDGRPDAVPTINGLFDALLPPRPAALLEGLVRDRVDGRRDRGLTPGSGRLQAGGELHDAHLPDQQGLPPGSKAEARDRMGPSRRELRDGDRRDVA